MRMTDEERRFAALNHDSVVYGFLNRQCLNASDWYDVVIIGYLAAVLDYSRRESAKKYSFSTIAYRKMQDAIHKHYREEETDKRRINHEIIGAEYIEIIPDSKNAIDRFMDEYSTMQTIAEIKAKLTPSEITVLVLLLSGDSQISIQRKSKTTDYAVRKAIRKIRIITAAIYGHKKQKEEKS